MRTRSYLAAVVLFLAALGASRASAENDSFGLGTGRDGDVTVGVGAFQIVNSYAAITTTVATGSSTVIVGSTTGFAVGNVVMLWQTTGLMASSAPVGDPNPIDVSATPIGTYELARIESINVGMNTITLTNPIVSPMGFAGGVSQLVRVPEYVNVTIPATSAITPAAWDGQRGGIVAFFASGTVMLGGQIGGSGVGFRGGIVENAAAGTNYATACAALDGFSPGTTPAGLPRPLQGGAHKGESLVASAFSVATGGAPATAYGHGNVANGGGGGNCTNSGGGGGGGAAPGGAGGNSWDGARVVGGRRGSAVTPLPGRLLLGGGGGAGESNNSAASAGGAGGGVVWIRVALMTGTGIIVARGLNATGAGLDGAGGGGGGGTIEIYSVAPTFGCSLVDVRGGNGGNPTAGHGAGGGGGGGATRLFGMAGFGCLLSASPGVGGVSDATHNGSNGTGGTNVVAGPYAGAPCTVGQIRMGVCGGCVSNAECAGATPVCDLATNSCVECTTPADCDDANTCTTETCAANLCGRMPAAAGAPCPGGVCSGAPTNLCVECVSDAQCGGATPRCDTATNSCVECVGAGDCNDANACTSDVCAASVCSVTPLSSGAMCPGGVCTGAPTNLCVVCVSDAQCGGATPRCDTGTNTCVQCLGAADCNDGSSCTTDSCSAGACSASPLAMGAVCPGGVCTGAPTNLCVTCLTDAECTGVTPRCDPSTSLCVACLAPTDCNDGNACTTDGCSAGACTAMGIASGTACPGGVCTGAPTNLCVTCINDAQCGGLTPFCELSTNTCVACLSGADCVDGDSCTQDLCTLGACGHPPEPALTSCLGGVCDGAGACVACLDDSTCSSPTPRCETGTRTCVACLGAGDCDDANACTSDVCAAGSCSNPDTAIGQPCPGGVCTGGPANTCVACLSDANCAAPNPRCDTATSTCVECFVGADCGPGGTCVSQRCIGRDSDGDGIDDVADGDADNDGITDVDEGSGLDASADDDGDRIPNYLDPDFAGRVDTNSDGLDDRFDPDADGVPSFLDRDSDGDGIPDLDENAGTLLDVDRDGLVDAFVDADGDGVAAIFDADDNDPANRATRMRPVDTDGTIPDFLDLDSDGDGVFDVAEGGGIDADMNGLVDSSLDANRNGIATIVDPSEGGTPLPLPDTDADGALDFQDAVDDRPDAGMPDAGVADGDVPDGAAPDGAAPDGGLVDAIAPDATIGDAITPDASLDAPDAAVGDAIAPDAIVSDAIVTDGARPDALDAASDARSDAFADAREGGSMQDVVDERTADEAGADALATDAHDVDVGTIRHRGGLAGGALCSTRSPERDRSGIFVTLGLFGLAIIARRRRRRSR